MSAVMPGEPPAPTFIRAYCGRDSANMNRRWAWQAVPGATRYLVEPDWCSPIYTNDTQWEHRESYARVHEPFASALAQGRHSITVRAEVDGVLSPPATDVISVRYSTDPSITHFQKQDVGLGGVTGRLSADNRSQDVLGVRYSFAIRENQGIPPGTKIIFGSTSLTGPSGTRYDLVQQFNTDLRQYTGPLVDQHYPPPYTTPGQASLMFAVPREPTGMTSHCGDMLPLVFTCIDGDRTATNKLASFQRGLNGLEGEVIVERGELIAGRDGWLCIPGRLLGDETYREWRMILVVDGESFAVSAAIPEDYGQWVSPERLQMFRWEFPLFPGRLVFQVWDVKFRRPETDWQLVPEWYVGEYKGFTTDFGIKVASYGSKSVIELGNDAPNEYLPLGAIFST